jgi:hypothetical protein
MEAFLLHVAVVVASGLSLVRSSFEVSLDPEYRDALSRYKIFPQQCIHHMARGRSI